MVISTDKPKQQGVVVRNETENTADPLMANSQSDIAVPEESSETDGLLVIHNLDVVAARRLIVLIPNLDVDEVALAHEIWNLALPRGLAVLLLGLCPNPNDEPGARRRLVTVAALIREPRVSVETQLDFGRNWISILKNFLKMGDIVICPADQRIGIFGEPLDLSLAKLGLPIITLPGLYPPTRKLIPRFILESVFLLVHERIMLTPENNQTEIMRRESDYKPPRSLSHWFIGRPLSTADAPHQTIGKAIGLAVFASDALSSTAYATQEILGVLAAVSIMATGYVFSVSIAIVILLAIVTISYQQTIHSYPGGGGAYIVARDNLGEGPAQTAGAALLTDYILTVAVSVASGVAQIVSAYPDLFPYRVWIAVGSVVVITIINLRGVKESGSAFAITTYFFLVMMVGTVGIGLFRYFTVAMIHVVDMQQAVVLRNNLGVLTPLIFLHAFANGTTALTGVEAISNGITAFKEPRSRNAGITLIWMSVILGSLFLGISYLTGKIVAVLSEQ